MMDDAHQNGECTRRSDAEEDDDSIPSKQSSRQESAGGSCDDADLNCKKNESSTEETDRQASFSRALSELQSLYKTYYSILFLKLEGYHSIEATLLLLEKHPSLAAAQVKIDGLNKPISPLWLLILVGAGLETLAKVYDLNPDALKEGLLLKIKLRDSINDSLFFNLCKDPFYSAELIQWIIQCYPAALELKNKFDGCPLPGRMNYHPIHFFMEQRGQANNNAWSDENSSEFRTLQTMVELRPELLFSCMEKGYTSAKYTHPLGMLLVDPRMSLESKRWFFQKAATTMPVVSDHDIEHEKPNATFHLHLREPLDGSGFSLDQIELVKMILPSLTRLKCYLTGTDLEAVSYLHDCIGNTSELETLHLDLLERMPSLNFMRNKKCRLKALELTLPRVHNADDDFFASLEESLKDHNFLESLKIHNLSISDGLSLSRFLAGPAAPQKVGIAVREADGGWLKEACVASPGGCRIRDLCLECDFVSKPEMWLESLLLDLSPVTSALTKLRIDLGQDRVYPWHTNICKTITKILEQGHLEYLYLSRFPVDTKQLSVLLKANSSLKFLRADDIYQPDEEFAFIKDIMVHNTTLEFVHIGLPGPDDGNLMLIRGLALLNKWGRKAAIDQNTSKSCFVEFLNRLGNLSVWQSRESLVYELLRSAPTIWA